MDIYNYVNQVLEEIKLVERSKQLDFIKLKLQRIDDNHQKKAVENLLFANLNSSKSFARPSVKVLMLHGINTNGIWQYKLKRQLKSASNVDAYPIPYGYYNLFSFLIPKMFEGASEKRVKEQLLSFLKGKQDGEKVVIIAHSFGTYILAEILKTLPDLEIDRILFCGSIVKENYSWENVDNVSDKSFINDCGTYDIWPSLAKFNKPFIWRCRCFWVSKRCKGYKSLPSAQA